MSEFITMALTSSSVAELWRFLHVHIERSNIECCFFDLRTCHRDPPSQIQPDGGAVSCLACQERLFMFVLYSACNDKVVPWRRKLFTVPSSKASVCFLQGVARSHQSYAESPTLDSVALYAAMAVMPYLLLQHPPGNLPSKLLFTHFKCCFVLWLYVDINTLLVEGWGDWQGGEKSDKLACKFFKQRFSGIVKYSVGIMLWSDADCGCDVPYL